MSTPSISVIIPAYNVENYITECLDSVFSQQYLPHEVIIIDDGSVDQTKQRIEVYQERQPLIRLLTQKNSGQGVARNRALEYVTGDYVLFLDADDKLGADLFKKLAVAIAAHLDVDIVHFNWQYFFQQADEVESYTVRDHDKILTTPLLKGSECDRLLTITNYFSINNLFRYDFLRHEGVQFGERMIYEDNAMMVKAITRANTIVNINEPLYLYRKENESSSSRSGYTSSKHYKDAITAMYQAVDQLQQRTPYTAYYLLNYYTQKMVVYYERRIPKRYQRAFIRQVVDSLCKLNVKNYPPNVPKFTKLIIDHQLIQKKRYFMITCLVKYKVILSRLTRAQP